MDRMGLCVCGRLGVGLEGCLSPFSPPACPHPVFSRAACESSQRAEGPSCLPLPPPAASSAVPFIKSSPPCVPTFLRAWSNHQRTRIPLSLFLAPHRVQAESYDTERQKNPPFSLYESGPILGPRAC